MLKVGNIRQEWETIKPGLESVKERSNEDWLIEDVYSDCITGKSTLFISKHGFLIARVDQVPYTEETTLFIWIVFSFSNSEWPDYIGEAEEIARSVGAKSISGISRRGGWARKGLQDIYTFYKRRLHV